MKIFNSLQTELPTGLDYFYEHRAHRLIVISFDARFKKANNPSPIPDRIMVAFEDGAKWSEVRRTKGKDVIVRCRIVTGDERNEIMGQGIGLV